MANPNCNREYIYVAVAYIGSQGSKDALACPKCLHQSRQRTQLPRKSNGIHQPILDRGLRQYPNRSKGRATRLRYMQWRRDNRVRERFSCTAAAIRRPGPARLRKP